MKPAKKKSVYIGFNKKLEIFCNFCHSKRLSWIPCLNSWICLNCKIYNQAIDDCLKALKGQIPAEQEEDWTMRVENIRLREALEKIASTNYDLREKIAIAKQALGDK